MKEALDALSRRALAVPVAAVRPYLLLKLTLVLLALDMWLTRASHAGRYGAGGFNVAHWAWLDAAQPPIEPAYYVGACVLTSALCLAIAFADRPPRWLLALACLVHTWSWAMSMLDSYQHHYLLSIVLAAMVFFPPLRADEALRASEAPAAAPAAKPAKRKKRKKPAPDAPPPRASGHPFVRAWSYTLLCASIAIVYAYTAFSKADPEWLAGAALRQVMQYPADGVVPGPGANVAIRTFHGIIEGLGEHGALFWFVMGHSVVVVQIVVCAGYLLAPWRDAARSRVTQAFFFVALGTALSFHVGAELMGLEIGWFSYYMVGYALIAMLPGGLLVRVARAMFWLVLDLRRERDALPPWAPLALAGVAALALVSAGWTADLPGAREASVLAAVLLGAGVVAALLRAGDARAITGYAVGALLAALGFALCVQLSELRWDYWRNVGGDHRRRGEVEQAYAAYVKANRYAPDGQDRRRQEDEMRAILEQRGLLPRRGGR